MSGSVYRASNWDEVYEQQFLAISPIGDEISLYQTNYQDSGLDSSLILKVASRGDFQNISCSSYSVLNRGITGVGSLHGTVSIFDIFDSNSSILLLNPKQRRKCYSISFCHSRNLLAIGFDKGRQDNSLQVWDVEHYSRTASNSHISRPLSTYIANEAILSTTFYPHDDNSFLCGSYKFLREIDLRQEKPALQLATKYTLGLVTDPFRPYSFMSHTEDGSVGVWDRRKLTGNSFATVNASSKLKISMTYVPTDEPILQFSKLLVDPTAKKNQKPCLRYSTSRPGEFSAVFHGDLIRRWNTGVVPAINPSTANNTASASSKLSSDPIVQMLKSQACQLYAQNDDSPFVHLVLDTKTDFERVISFDYAPNVASKTSTNFVCMRQSGLVFLMPVVECLESVDFNSYNEISISGSEGTLTKFNIDRDIARNRLANHQSQCSAETHFEANRHVDPISFNTHHNNLKINHEPLFGGNYSETGSMVDDESTVANYARPETKGTFDQDFYDDDLYIPVAKFMGASNVLANDICTIIRKRAQLGYAVDCDTNINLLENTDALDNYLNLSNTWRWLSLAKKSLDKGTMISEGLDLGYQGVLGIWNGIVELNDRMRVTSYGGRVAHPNRDPISEARFSNAVKQIVALKGTKIANITIPNTSDKKAQRKLCLIVSGWYLTDVEFEEKLLMLVQKGQVEKAAGWAVFMGNVDKAIDILASSKNERFRLMSTAVAGYLAFKSSITNSPWKDQCRKMASELDNPYLRAIFAFIADNDWWDVLDENSLPLRERLGVALRFLLDKDLDVYLNRIKDIVVSKGELEGLILTGITPKGFDLLQSFVDRTCDVQTAALVSAFACPRYFDDERATSWVDCYRTLLNSWGMFSARAKFDVLRMKLSKTTSGLPTIRAAPKQVYLQCIRCNKNISRPKSTGPVGNLGLNANTHAMMKQFNKLSSFSSNKNKTPEDITSCSHCGAPLPRCSICLLTLSAPLPQQSGDSLGELDIATRIENRFKEWISLCLTCGHGYHAHHAEEWFSKHYICPVPDCSCYCNSK